MKKWVVKNKNKQDKNICNNNLISNLLLNRGITSNEGVKEFLYPSLEELYNPFLLKDMDKAVERIDAAVQGREKVVIYGDYDVDGITSTSILFRAFKKLGVDVGYYIPDRVNEGYSINKEALNYLKTLATDLIITVDCGISSIAEVEYAKSLGIDIIVTDHHECKDVIPDAIVINPKRLDCTYPFKQLSGCGVAFKLIQALWKFYGLTGYDDLLDIAAIGTVADVVALVDENRIIVKHGLKLLKESEKCGIKALKSVSGIDGDVSTYNIAFQMAPRINAVGRLSDAKIAVELFITNDYDKALQIAKYLDMENKKRQEIEENIYNECLEMIEKEVDLKSQRVIVLSSYNWHIGVVGIVASKLVEKFSRPVLLICNEGEIGRGSGRSVEGFNLFDNLCECKDVLTKFGGHELAAGLTIDLNKIDEFKSMMNDLAFKVDAEVFQEKLKIDMYLDSNDVNEASAEYIKRLEPFGCGNPAPVFAMEGLSIVNKREIGDKKQHLKLSLEKNGANYESIFFNGSNPYSSKAWEYIDVAFNMDINVFRERRNLQLMLKDIRPNKDWIIESFKKGYYKGLKGLLSDKIDSFDFSRIKFIEKNIDFLNEFIYLKKGHILVSTRASLLELKDYLDSIELSININTGFGNQIIFCPNVEEIEFGLDDVLIYDFLPGEYEYNVVVDKTSGKVFNFMGLDSFDKINELHNDINIDKVLIDRFLKYLGYNDFIGSIEALALNQDINPFIAYNIIMFLRETKKVDILVKGDELKIILKDKNFNSRINEDFKNIYASKLSVIENKLREILGR